MRTLIFREPREYKCTLVQWLLQYLPTVVMNIQFERESGREGEREGGRGEREGERLSFTDFPSHTGYRREHYCSDDDCTKEKEKRIQH